MRQIEATHVLSKAASQPYYSGRILACSWFLVPGSGEAKGSCAQDLDSGICSSSEGAETLRTSGQRSPLSRYQRLWDL